MTDQQLRERLVERLERTRVLSDARVEGALRAVPRHRFIPAISLEDAYEDRALAIKERNGAVISSISQPSMIVQMLQMLDVRAGQTILEIGTGSGYHAALLATLATPKGHVLSTDIEPDLIDEARGHLSELGYTNVEVRDADSVFDLQGPFDRIVVTARADDIDAQWWRLLADGGRIVVPLEIGYGGERAVGFVRTGEILESIGTYACAFIGMRGNAEGYRESEIFFPNRDARYDAVPEAHMPLSIVAVRREDATPEMMKGADIIVARPITIFALRF